MLYLVTGGCGFIGRNLIAKILQDKNNSVRVIDNLSVGTREQLAEIYDFVEYDSSASNTGSCDGKKPFRLELIVGDIRDADLAKKVSKGADVLVHLAANTGVGPSVENPIEDCLSNVIGTLNYLESCRHNNVKRFVLASSGAPIGNCEPPIHEELPTHPVSPYGASKLSGEAYCSAYKHSYNVDTVVLRFGNCYGPLSGHKSSVVAKFIRDALFKASWEVFGDGTQSRDFIFVGDVVDAIVLAANVPGIGGEVFQIATSAETTVLELIEKLASVLLDNGVEPPKVSHASPRIGDVRRNFSDTRKANSRLGWTPKVTLDAGLTYTVEWFLKLTLKAQTDKVRDLNL